MEKKIGSKEVNVRELNPVKKEQQEHPQKLSYEELNQACAEMSQQIQQQNKFIQQLRMQMQQMEFMLQNKRMDYLFKVLEIGSPVFSDSFIESCATEVQESLTIPKDEEGESNGVKDGK